MDNEYEVTPTFTVGEEEEYTMRMTEGDFTGMGAGPSESGCLA